MLLQNTNIGVPANVGAFSRWLGQQRGI